MTKNNEIQRRSFAKTAIAGTIGVAAIGAPVCAAVRATISPTLQKGAGGKFYPITTVDQIEAKPKKFAILDESRDAWSVSPNQQIGSIFLVKNGEQIQAFQTVCPHAGCGIQAGNKKNPKTDTEELLFFCPCHAAFFTLEGARLDEVSPRNMDELTVKIEDNIVHVQFQHFKVGSATK